MLFNAPWKYSAINWPALISLFTSPGMTFMPSVVHAKIILCFCNFIFLVTHTSAFWNVLIYGKARLRLKVCMLKFYRSSGCCWDAETQTLCAKLSLCVTYCTEIAFALRYPLVTSEVPSAQGEYGTAAILKGRRTVCYSTENKYVTVHIFISPDKGKSPGIRNRGNIKWVDGLMGCLKGVIKARGFDASEKETLQSIGCSSRKSFGVSTKWVWVGNKGWSCLWRIQ